MGWPVGRTPRAKHSALSNAGDLSYIARMTSVVTVLMVLALAATVIVIVVGVIGMARGGEFNRRYANRLMRLRIVFQGLAVLLFAILIFATGKS